MEASRIQLVKRAPLRRFKQNPEVWVAFSKPAGVVKRYSFPSLEELIHRGKVSVVGVPESVSGRASSNVQWLKEQGIPIFQTFQRLLQKAKPDLVLVCSNSSKAHHAEAKEALEHGSSVLIEKPALWSHEQAEELVSLAIRNKRYIGSTTQYALNRPLVKKLAEITSDKDVDHIHLEISYVAKDYPTNPTTNTETAKELGIEIVPGTNIKADGGIGFALAPYFLGLPTTIFGSKPVSYSIRENNAGQPDYELDSSGSYFTKLKLRVNFENGKTANIDLELGDKRHSEISLFNEAQKVAGAIAPFNYTVREDRGKESIPSIDLIEKNGKSEAVQFKEETQTPPYQRMWLDVMKLLQFNRLQNTFQFKHGRGNLAPTNPSSPQFFLTEAGYLEHYANTMKQILSQQGGLTGTSTANS